MGSAITVSSNLDADITIALSKKARDPFDHLLLCPTVSMDAYMSGLATFTAQEIIHG